jgi:hypothetical protein
MRSICTKQLMISLATFASLGMAANITQAQEVARVVSLTPNVRQVQTPKLVCTLDAYKNQTCTNQTITQNVNDGYNVVYEYEGRLFTMFSAVDPGPYIQLNVAQPNYAPPTTTYVQPPPVYGPSYGSGFGPTYAQPSYPATAYAPIIVRSPGYGFGYVPRPVVVVRGGGFHGGYHRGYANGGHHGGRGHYR